MGTSSEGIRPDSETSLALSPPADSGDIMRAMFRHALRIGLIFASPVLASQQAVRTPTDVTVYAVSPGEDKSVTLYPMVIVHRGTDQRYDWTTPPCLSNRPKRRSRNTRMRSSNRDLPSACSWVEINSRPQRCAATLLLVNPEVVLFSPDRFHMARRHNRYWRQAPKRFLVMFPLVVPLQRRNAQF
jgi:hypothetical protein